MPCDTTSASSTARCRIRPCMQVTTSWALRNYFCIAILCAQHCPLKDIVDSDIPAFQSQEQLTACGCLGWYVCIWRWRLGKSVWEGLNLNLGLRVHLLCKAYLSASKTYTKMCLSLQIPAISSDQHHSQLSSVPTRLLTPVLVSNPNLVVRGQLVPPTLLHYTAWPLLSYLQHSILLPTDWELYMHSWLCYLLCTHMHACSLSRNFQCLLICALFA